MDPTYNTRVMIRIVTLVTLLASAAPAHAQSPAEGPVALPPDDSALPSTMHCPVDDLEVRDRKFGVEFNGRRYYMESAECQEHFMHDPDTFARAIEPRAALFRAQDPSRTSYGNGFLIFASLIVVGLVFGAASSYLAVQKGHAPVPWFAAGFFLNVLGLVAISSRKTKEMPFTRDGLTKIPRTHEPTTCSQCGQPNHPSADHCAGCSAELNPTIPNEAAEALGRKRP